MKFKVLKQGSLTVFPLPAQKNYSLRDVYLTHIYYLLNSNATCLTKEAKDGQNRNGVCRPGAYHI